MRQPNCLPLVHHFFVRSGYAVKSIFHAIAPAIFIRLPTSLLAPRFIFALLLAAATRTTILTAFLPIGLFTVEPARLVTFLVGRVVSLVHDGLLRFDNGKTT